jgi:hypothetical protein
MIGVVEGRSLWLLAPEHIDLLAKNQDVRFTPRAGLEQSNERTTKQSEQLDHRATAAPDSHRFATCMACPTGAGHCRTAWPCRHADDRKHYTHLAPSYVADTIRAHFPVLGITAETTVTPIRRRKLAFAGNNPRRIP